MKKILFVLIVVICVKTSLAQAVTNTSYITSVGERVLRFEFIIPVDQKTAWKYFTTDDKLAQWIAPLAHIELKTGGYIVTNYDKNKSLEDKSSIRLGIINYIENELLTLKIKLNDNFPKSAQAEDQNLQELIQLTKIDDTHTKVSSSMVGWGMGDDWDKTYNFFKKGNEWTAMEIVKIFTKKN